MAGTGAAVQSVEPGSAADRAGVRPGDVITMIAGVAQPSPADVREAFASMKDAQSLLVGITRGSSHHVLAMVK